MNPLAFSTEKLIELVTLYGLRVLGAIAIFFIGRAVAKLLRNGIRRLLAKGNVDETLSRFITSLSYIALLAFVVIASLNQLGVQTTSLIAVLGAAGLAVGLALQGSLSNFAAGVLLILFKPFKTGDYIEGGGTAGTVEEIQILTTQLATPDNKTVIVPNAKMLGDNIVNYSSKGTRRVDMVFGIGYGDDIDKAKSILQTIIDGDQRVMSDPEPMIVVSALADSSVNLAVRVWTLGSDYWGFYFDTMEAVKKAFDAENVTIPFPQRDVHFYREPDGGTEAFPLKESRSAKG
jgi:small conductance mechanosensitive channel